MAVFASTLYFHSLGRILAAGDQPRCTICNGVVDPTLAGSISLPASRAIRDYIHCVLPQYVWPGAQWYGAFSTGNARRHYGAIIGRRPVHQGVLDVSDPTSTHSLRRARN